MSPRIKKIRFTFYIMLTFFSLVFFLTGTGILLTKHIITYPLSVYILSGLTVLYGFAGVANSGYYLSLDYATGLLNKDFFIKCLIYLMIRKKYHLYTAVFMNIKGLTYINEHYSSRVGDMVLKLYAANLRDFAVRGEYLSRLGGDNFLALIKKERIPAFLDMLSHLRFTVRADNDENVILDIGTRCGLYDMSDSDIVRDVMGNSGIAFKQARLSGKEDYVWFEQDMLAKILMDNTLINSFDDAIKNEEFVVYYQPKVDLLTGKLEGAEALVRWIKDGKMIPPMDFIPVFEREGLVTRLDFYVFEKVCKDLVDWESRGISIVTVSSNFSKLHIRNHDFAKNVVDVINKYKTKSYSLEIELTESGANENFDVFKRFVDDIHKAGIKISIDDFGTGYSSLSLLKNIDADVVKLDKSFIDNVHDDKSDDYNLVCNLVKLIKDLGCEVICEGVETLDQAELMKKAGCNLIQGYYFDRPLPHDDFEKRLINKAYSS